MRKPAPCPTCSRPDWQRALACQAFVLGYVIRLCWRAYWLALRWYLTLIVMLAGCALVALALLRL